MAPCILGRRLFAQIVEVMEPAAAAGSAPQGTNDDSSSSVVSGCLAFSRAGDNLLYKLVMILPVVAFTLFLILRVRSSVRKLLQSRSHIMATYYAFLWVISILNIVWCILEMKRSSEPTLAWNLVSLITRAGMIMLEVSVVVFLSQGYLTSTWDALVRTLAFSGAVAGLDALLKAFYIFRLGVPLFVTGDDLGDWQKWSFLLFYALIFAGIYFFILILPLTKWRDQLPARPAFYNYVLVLFVVNCSDFIGSVLIACGAAFGYCIYSFTSYAYYAFYPPLLYMTFLADFFREEDFQLEDVYYSEMKDAGYFDADWD